MATVVLRSLTKIYANGVRAVSDLSLEAADGRMFVLLGPSGCGKTTTLRMIAGLESPTSGQVHLNGRDVTGLPPHARNVAMMFQTPALYPHVNVRQNLAFEFRLRYNLFNRLLRRAERRRLQERIGSAVELLQLEPLLERRPAQLSGGERQRVALGRAFIRRPAVFLLDEPLAHLDAPLRRQMARELREFQRRLRATMIYVTHDHAEALALGDDVAVVREGSLEQFGTPEELYRRPASRFVAEFIGFPKMNILEGCVVREENGLTFVTGSRKVEVPGEWCNAFAEFGGRSVALGIRPEDMALSVDANVPGNSGWRLPVARVESWAGNGWATLADHGVSLAVAIRADSRPEAGETRYVTWDWRRVCVFDGSTGRVLTSLPAG